MQPGVDKIGMDQEGVFHCGPECVIVHCKGWIYGGQPTLTLELQGMQCSREAQWHIVGLHRHVARPVEKSVGEVSYTLEPVGEKGTETSHERRAEIGAGHRGDAKGLAKFASHFGRQYRPVLAVISEQTYALCASIS